MDLKSLQQLVVVMQQVLTVHFSYPNIIPLKHIKHIDRIKNGILNKQILFTSSLHQLIGLLEIWGIFISNQQGPLIFWSKSKSSRNEVLVPNILLNVFPLKSSGKAGKEAFNKIKLIKLYQIYY